MIERFEDLEAWRRARLLVRQIYGLTRSSVVTRDFGLCSQIQRAGVSIMSNVAEGFERVHISEKIQFYSVARASTAEVRSLSYVVEDNFAGLADDARRLREQANEVGRLVTELLSSTEKRRRSLSGPRLPL
jgi:four helix bundle protein